MATSSLLTTRDNNNDEHEEAQRREEEQQLIEVEPLPLRALEPSATSSDVVDLPIATMDDDKPQQEQHNKQEELYISKVRQFFVPNDANGGLRNRAARLRSLRA